MLVNIVHAVVGIALIWYVVCVIDDLYRSKVLGED